MQKRGRTEEICYTVAQSPLGPMLVARSGVGICAVAFGDDLEQMEQQLRKRFPKAELRIAPLNREVAVALAQFGAAPPEVRAPLDLRGGDFHRRAWVAMQAIPRGETVTYQQLAARLNVPKGQVAVGAACAANAVAVLIPCHRVVATGGGLHNYRWGLERKRRLLELERIQVGKAAPIPEMKQGELPLGD